MLTVLAHRFPAGEDKGSTYQFRQIPIVLYGVVFGAFANHLGSIFRYVTPWFGSGRPDPNPVLLLAFTPVPRMVRRSCILQFSGRIAQ